MPEAELHFAVGADEAGERLDRLVAQAAGISRRVARTWIATGRVLVGKKPLRILTKPMRAGAEITVRRPDGQSAAGGTPRASIAGANATSRPEGPRAHVDPARRGPGGVHAAGSRGGDRGPGLDHAARREPGGSATARLRVLFADRWLLVVEKPAGLLTEHDRFGSPSVESLAPVLLASRGERTQIWLVHRLDAGTSGVLALARTPMAAKVLGEAFRAGSVHKTYLALCRGRFEGERVVEAPIARAERTRHVVSPKGKPARTRFVSVAASDEATLVRAVPSTGRTHQIRVHLAHLGHPLLGDGLYGGPTYSGGDAAEPIGRPMLHAARLRLPHPKTGEPVELTAPAPEDFTALAARYGLALPGNLT